MPVDNNYMPPQDAQLLNWATNFATLTAINFAAYGITTGQASAFGTLKTTYATALGLATNPSTRTKSTVAAKNAAKSAMITNGRTLANIIQANPAVTNTQRQDLGLTVRSRIPTPIGPPTSAPIVTPLSTAGLAINFRFADTLTPASRAKPFGVTALQVYTKVGTTPPASIADCSLHGTYTNNTSGPGSAACVLNFDGLDAGKTCYMIGRWINRRGETGPVSSTAQMTVAA